MLFSARMREQSARYLRIMVWIVRDAFGKFPGAMILALTASVIGVLGQGGVLSLLLIYGAYLQDDRPLDVLGYSLEPRTPEIFLGVSAASFTLLLISAFLIFLSKRRAASLSVQYNRYCLDRSMEYCHWRSRTGFEGFRPRKVITSISTQAVMDSNACGIALGTIIGAAYPLVTIVYMCVFLLYINPAVTTFMFLLFLGFMGVHYRVSIFAVENELFLRRLLPEFRKFARDLYSAADQRRFRGAVDRLDGMAGYFTSLRNRRVSVAKADFSSNIMIALAIGMSTIYLGQLALAGTIAWGEMIVYLVALRVTVVGVRGVLNTIASYARWYPNVRGYYESAGAGQVPQAWQVNGDRVAARNVTGEGDVQELTWRAGDIIAAHTPIECSRYTMIYFAENLLGLPSDVADQVVRNGDFLPAQPAIEAGMTLRQVLSVGSGLGWDDLRALTPGLAVVEDLMRLSGGDLEYKLDSAGIVATDSLLPTRLWLLSILIARRHVVFMSVGALNGLPRTERDIWVRLLRQTLLVMNYGHHFRTPCEYGEKYVVAGDEHGQGSLSSVEWFREHRRRVKVLIRARRSRAAKLKKRSLQAPVSEAPA